MSDLFGKLAALDDALGDRNQTPRLTIEDQA
jgi:hypothetical protein